MIGKRKKAAEKKVGLALGAGAARGCAHLGVLRAIREAGIEIHCVAGTSIGSLIGAVFASGNEERLQESLLHMEWSDILSYFFEISIPRSGLLDGKRIADFIGQYVADVNLEDLPLSCRTVATDVLTGSEVVLDRGPISEAVRASIAFPGIFTPVVRGETVLVDGGLVNPVPVSVVRDMGAEVVIAVDINYDRLGSRQRSRTRDATPPKEKKPLPVPRDDGDAEWHHRLKSRMTRKWSELDNKMKSQLNRWTERDTAPNIFDVLGNTILIMEAQIAETMLAQTRPDVLIRPEVGGIGFLEFNQAETAIRAGYEAAVPALSVFTVNR